MTKNNNVNNVDKPIFEQTIYDPITHRPVFKIVIRKKGLAHVSLELFDGIKIRVVVVDALQNRSGWYMMKNNFSDNKMRAEMTISKILGACQVKCPTKAVGDIIIVLLGHVIKLKTRLAVVRNNSNLSVVQAIYLNGEDEPLWIADDDEMSEEKEEEINVDGGLEPVTTNRKKRKPRKRAAASASSSSSAETMIEDQEPKSGTKRKTSEKTKPRKKKVVAASSSGDDTGSIQSYNSQTLSGNSLSPLVPNIITPPSVNPMQNFVPMTPSASTPLTFNTVMQNFIPTTPLMDPRIPNSTYPTAMSQMAASSAPPSPNSFPNLISSPQRLFEECITDLLAYDPNQQDESSNGNFPLNSDFDFLFEQDDSNSNSREQNDYF
ncbi:predicted protein [Naegleria gruberi]|uniref:Predicted protein n=1 Tax=Naegleria gruberi TaxID=5762 RepID=D2W4G7_NAEGR|nr:uncharacterized protein NAEGRDRAFT_54609 [Naegleria gruberi]EFC36036.1 predicted protein [Naegleria gruberi]|eukprot:XP_002668780.1 predicted protein [Naegleria gruberi strain NEG-M]